MSKELLTMHEAHVLFDLAEAWNKYRLLPDHPPDDIDDFRKAVHDAQRIVLARTGRRQLPDTAGNGPILPEISLKDLKELAEQMKQLATYSPKSHKSPAEAT